MAWGSGPGAWAVRSKGPWSIVAAGRSDKNACDAVGGPERLAGARGTVIDSGLTAESPQQESSEGIEPI